MSSEPTEIDSLPAADETMQQPSIEDDDQKNIGAHITSFDELQLKPELMKAIRQRGFESPSDIQSQAIPLALQGIDVLCQARSGMGKTAIYVISIINQIDFKKFAEDKHILAIVITHTRELAIQAKKEFKSFLTLFPGVKCMAVFGGAGSPKEEDNIRKIKTKRPAIIVGTPGRLDALCRRAVDFSHVKHFVVDECDNIVSSRNGNVKMREAMQNVFMKTPKNKQVMMLSATMPEKQKEICLKYLKEGFKEIVIPDDQLTLHGLQQYQVSIDEMNKTRKLKQIIEEIGFNQCIVFVKSSERAEALAESLTKIGIAAKYTSSRLDVQKRLKIYEHFKRNDIRILVVGDLYARGIDVEKIDLAINFDMPDSHETYLHRVGRAGRFNTRGIAISFVSSTEDATMINNIQTKYNVQINDYDKKDVDEQ